MVRRRLAGLAAAVLLAVAAWRFAARAAAVVAQHRLEIARLETAAPPPAASSVAPVVPSGAAPGEPSAGDATAPAPAADTPDTADAGPIAPVIWRFDSRVVRQLRRCVNQVRQRVPSGDTVAVAVPAFDDSAYAFAWVAYLLPDRRVVRRADLADWRDVEWLLSHGAPVEDPRLGPGERLFCGWLYPIRPAPGPGSRP